jgi:hypothetical protein
MRVEICVDARVFAMTRQLADPTAKQSFQEKVATRSTEPAKLRPRSVARWTMECQYRNDVEEGPDTHASVQSGVVLACGGHEAQLSRARRLPKAVKQGRSIHHRDTETRRRSQEMTSERTYRWCRLPTRSPGLPREFHSGAAKQARKQSIITQITQIKSQITPIRIVWRFAQERCPTPREAHSIPFRVICDLICVICVDLDCFLPHPSAPAC